MVAGVGLGDEGIESDVVREEISKALFSSAFSANTDYGVGERDGKNDEFSTCEDEC